MAHTHSTLTNPFFNRQRIVDPDFFCGRDGEIEALYSAIATHQCRSIVGDRKLGKSSLLTHLSCPPTLRQHGLDPEKFIFLYIDLEGMANISYDEFWPEIIDRLEPLLPENQTELRNLTHSLALERELRFTQVRRLFRRIERAGLSLVIMFDEFESLAANSDFDAGFYGELRSLAGELGVIYITASKQSLYNLTYKHAETLSSPFFNIFSEIRVGLMPRPEGAQLLQKLSSRPEQAPFAPDQIKLLLEMAGTHPFFLQIAGSHLYTGRAEGLNGEALTRQVARRFLAEAEDHFRYLWRQLSEMEQVALRHPTTIPAGTRLQLYKQLQTKALLHEEKEGHWQPFSQSFAEFVERTDVQVERRPARDSSTSDLTGATLGNYRILAPLGRGGMAVVYKGYQPSLDRYVAIKVISHTIADDQMFVERFQREAAAVAQLRHQHIVQMFDFGVQDDISYMVMEFIDGSTLKDRLTNLRESQRAMSLAEVRQIIADIAAALDYAHAHSIVHRDIKPANIMLRREERLARLTGGSPFAAVLTDFGVARMMEGVQLTGTGATIGTPDYMSPEQARGDPAGTASDVYSLGIVLYEMLCGELPFIAESPMAVLLKHIQADPPSLLQRAPQLPAGLEAILKRALSKDPEKRFPTAGQLAVELNQLLDNNAPPPEKMWYYRKVS